MPGSFQSLYIPRPIGIVSTELRIRISFYADPENVHTDPDPGVGEQKHFPE